MVPGQARPGPQVMSRGGVIPQQQNVPMNVPAGYGNAGEQLMMVLNGGGQVCHFFSLSLFYSHCLCFCFSIQCVISLRWGDALQITGSFRWLILTFLRFLRQPPQLRARHSARME